MTAHETEIAMGKRRNVNMKLKNGVGEERELLGAFPQLKDERIRKIAFELCRQEHIDPEALGLGRAGVADYIGEENTWYFTTLPNGDKAVPIWLQYLRKSIEIVKAIDS